MCPVFTWQLSVCVAVTAFVILLGFIYTYVRQKGMKSLSAVPGATGEQSEKWPTG